MSIPAIRAEAVGKLYRLQHGSGGPKSFRELLGDLANAPLRRIRQLRGSEKSMEDFWALRDISFEVQPGEVIGIIGRNGAGKSTLLKVLSRIVEPTLGRVTMRGRVASLLEVGTGFHPELSGRENVYLNGSILGMRRKEIDAQFDEIVAFAEVERFLDTPVKRYSSGMYVRLAFAVAAHLNPEILIVDEVLAVGDFEFQKKCLGKMHDVSKGHGRTVLFVSHNMAAVRTLCTRALLLEHGTLTANSAVDEVVHRYLSSSSPAAPPVLTPERPVDAPIWITRASLFVDGELSSQALMGSQLMLRVEFECRTPTKHPRVGFVLKSDEGENLLNSNTRFQRSPVFEVGVSAGTITCDLGSPPLMPGKYHLRIWLGDISWDHHVINEAFVFEVYERDIWGNGQIPERVSLMWWPTKYSFDRVSMSEVV